MECCKFVELDSGKKEVTISFITLTSEEETDVVKLQFPAPKGGTYELSFYKTIEEALFSCSFEVSENEFFIAFNKSIRK